MKLIMPVVIGAFLLSSCAASDVGVPQAIETTDLGSQVPEQVTLPETSSETRVEAAGDPIAVLVGRLHLDRYKETIRGLTQFGDRREGTDRNRAAVDWIEAQLQSYGCVETERLVYENQPLPPSVAVEPPRAVGGGRPRGNLGQVRNPNNNINAQPDARLREINAQEPTPEPREQVYCTKVGSFRPDEMYIVSAHMDGRGYGEAANDDASGTALVMELARILSAPDVVTERSIRFILFNSEEVGTGSLSYVQQRQALQGREDPPGSGKYPEPKWLGIIQHDMMLFDHGMPRADGTVSLEQRLEADVNIEFQMDSQFARQSQELAWAIHASNEEYATDYPASVGSHMTRTDTEWFQDFVAAVSLRENERGTQIGNGWDPHWHQPTDLFSTFSDKDFLLGLNAAQTTLGAVARLAGTTLRD